MTWLDAFSKLAPGIAALSAALVAIAGLSTWRRQLKGQAEYELARRVLRAVLKVRDEMSGVRAPIILGGEYAAAYQEANLTPPDNGLPGADSKGAELVYERRWNRVVSAMRDLEAELLEAEVLWGAQVRASAAKLSTCIGELFAAVSMHLRMQATGDPHGTLARVVEQQFRILYEINSDAEPDAFGAKIAGAVREFEALLRPHLGSTK